MLNNNPRILVVEDNEMNRELLVRRCKQQGYHVTVATDGYIALGMLDIQSFDLVLLDIMMPKMNGYEVLKQMKADQDMAAIPVIMITAVNEVDAAAKCIKLGAEDVISKPFNSVFLLARIEASLEKRALYQRQLKMQEELDKKHRQIEIFDQQQMDTLIKCQQETIFILSELLESRFPAKRGHIERLGAYCRVLMEGLQFAPGFAHQVNDTFVTDVSNTSPLHDIGMAAIPENIINKDEALTEAERQIMESHTIIGGNALRKIEHGINSSYIRRGIEIVESHHERWDGTGYPHSLGGEDIPLSARICALADAYDSMTTKRNYKEQLSHEEAAKKILKESGGQFDPGITQVFRKVEPDMREIQLKIGKNQLN